MMLRLLMAIALLTFATSSYADPIKGPLNPTERRFMSQLPQGVILMWNRLEIPDGWAICDGSKGTPDLTKGVLAATNDPAATGKTDGQKEISFNISGTTGTARNNPDQWGWDEEASRGRSPAATGFDHTHTFSVTAKAENFKPEHTLALFIMKVSPAGVSPPPPRRSKRPPPRLK